MAALTEERTRAAQARLRLGLVVAVVVGVLIAAGLVWSHRVTAPPTAPTATPVDTLPGGPAGGVGGSGDWDVAAESAIAAAPMLAFPDAAALPQTLGTRSAGPPIAVPAARGQGPIVDEGFPPTPEGAIGQLAALDVAAFKDLNPQTYADAYRSITLPGAPDPAATPAGQEIATVYNATVASASDPAPIVSRWQLAGAQIKGSADGGAFVVACVLGELQAVKSNTVVAGAGDCQGLRWTGAQWRIAPGPAPAKAPDTWPGTDEFARAGYRATLGGPGGSP